MDKPEKIEYTVECTFDDIDPQCPNCKQRTMFQKYVHSETKITLTCPCCNKTMLYETVEKFNTKEI